MAEEQAAKSENLPEGCEGMQPKASMEFIDPRGVVQITIPLVLMQRYEALGFLEDAKGLLHSWYAEYHRQKRLRDPKAGLILPRA